MTNLVCPKCGHGRFNITAIEYHAWEVTVDSKLHTVFEEDRGCLDGHAIDNPDYVCLSCQREWAHHQLILPKQKYRVGLRAFTGVVEFNVEASSKEEAVDEAHELLMDEVHRDGHWDFEVDFTLVETA